MYILNHKRHCYFIFIKFINVASEINKYNGLITPLSLYPIKYLDELYLPYCSILETNILLTSISSKLNTFFVFIVKVAFFDFFIVKIYAFSVHSYIQ